jgi:DNA polymerase-3 subunit alpha
MAHFTVEDGNVRFGLGAVKNVGLGAIEAIVARGRREASSRTSSTSAPGLTSKR